MTFLVLDLGLFGKSMQLHHFDGHKPVPEGGVLFLTPTKEEGTEFATQEEAAQAIQRTVEHGRACNYASWKEENYLVVDKKARDQVLKAIKISRREKEKKEAVDGADAVRSDQA